MRLVVAAGLACLFVGITFILNDLITHWWGQTAGVDAPAARIPVEGIALAVFGLIVALLGERLKARRPAAARDKTPKAEKVVLYEHGPDRPY